MAELVTRLLSAVTGPVSVTADTAQFGFLLFTVCPAHNALNPSLNRQRMAERERDSDLFVHTSGTAVQQMSQRALLSVMGAVRLASRHASSSAC
mmetsp:Transcript_9443/g.21301  ORF Transcript_9443/g.21301 Transcript_9443/m.21301 type:complete len:94 (+) Transcript_9443:94-375(+)